MLGTRIKTGSYSCRSVSASKVIILHKLCQLELLVKSQQCQSIINILYRLKRFQKFTSRFIIKIHFELSKEGEVVNYVN